MSSLHAFSSLSLTIFTTFHVTCIPHWLVGWTSIYPLFSGHGLSNEVVARLENVRDRGVAWLMSQMDNFGWSTEDHPEGTVHAVIALASSVDHWPTKNDLVANLVIKQLEIELLDKLLR